jgi:hypothetical protein
MITEPIIISEEDEDFNEPLPVRTGGCDGEVCESCQ